MILKDFVNYSYGQNSINPHALTVGSDGTVCEYDANGNMVRKNEQLYQYDAENRLIKVTRNVTNLATASMHLTPGWNFMSLPVKPDDSKISSVLAGLTPGVDYDQVSRFNPVSGKFQNFVNDKEFNQFDKFELGAGYQIYVKNPSGIDITVQGKSHDRKFSIFPGWNEIGATSAVSQTQALFLANLQDGVDVNQLSWYNFSINQYQAPSSIDSGKAYFINGLRQSSWYIQQQNAQLETLAQYFYDGDGGRIKKVTSAATTTYIGSIFEKTATTTIKHIFMGPNRICSVSSTGDKSFYHSDHLGSSNIITNQAGNLIQNCEYLPYGEFSTRTGVSTTHYYFTGKELDDETGLMFYGARYYDPQLGRFITPDSIVQAPYDPQSFNRYSYCRNNPINLVDPTGHSFLGDIWDWFKDNIIDPIVNIGKAILSGDWKTIAIVVISIAANVILPGSGTIASNFLLNVALHVVRGAAIGALTGGISSEIMGGNFWQGARVGLVAGAITGAIQGVTTSEQFKNWQQGNGFRSDDVVKVEQAKAVNTQTTLVSAKGSDDAMRSVARPENFGESVGVGNLGDATGKIADVANQLGNYNKTSNFLTDLSKFVTTKRTQIPLGEMGYFDLLVDKYSGTIDVILPASNGPGIYNTIRYIKIENYGVEGCNPFIESRQIITAQ